MQPKRCFQYYRHSEIVPVTSLEEGDAKHISYGTEPLNVNRCNSTVSSNAHVPSIVMLCQDTRRIISYVPTSASISRETAFSFLLDYCNSLLTYINKSSMLLRLMVQNTLARFTTSASRYKHKISVLKSFYSFESKINKRNQQNVIECVNYANCTD